MVTLSSFLTHAVGIFFFFSLAFAITFASECFSSFCCHQFQIAFTFAICVLLLFLCCSFGATFPSSTCELGFKQELLKVDVRCWGKGGLQH